MVRMSIDGVPRDAGAVPSSEWPLHTAVLRARADAVAVSLAMWASQLAIGAVGGVVQLVAPVQMEERE